MTLVHDTFDAGRVFVGHDIICMHSDGVQVINFEHLR